MARLVFLGTPEIAVPPLRALQAAGHEMMLVISRPDRRRGRGSATSPSPVKAAALDLDLPCADDLDQVAEAAAAGAELAVVVAYGRIIPERLLTQLPMVNLHFSLLPRWRGAAPVERAILAGDARTGVCVMGVEVGLDTGPVYDCRTVTIGDHEPADELKQRLSVIGAELLVDLLARGVGQLPVPTPQSGEPVYAAKIEAADLELSFDEPAELVARHVRLGRAWTTFRGKRVRILRAVPTAEEDGAMSGSGPEPGSGPESGARPEPGAEVRPGAMVGELVVTGEGHLRLDEVQPEGSRPMAAAAWLRGVRPQPGERLGGSGDGSGARGGAGSGAGGSGDRGAG